MKHHITGAIRGVIKKFAKLAYKLIFQYLELIEYYPLCAAMHLSYHLFHFWKHCLEEIESLKGKYYDILECDINRQIPKLVAGFFGMLVPMYQTIRLRFPYG
jgi:hypothetical protein